MAGNITVCERGGRGEEAAGEEEAAQIFGAAETQLGCVMADEAGGPGFWAALLNLPWQIQLSLGSGYAAYLLSYSGLRSHHKAIDTTFSTLVFGLVATGTCYSALKVFPPVIAGVVAFAVACFVGLTWRKVGRSSLDRLLRNLNISWSNDDPSAWASILADSKHRVSQIAVMTTDGEWLECRDTRPFTKAPFGPCKLGPNGDVALYVTNATDIKGIEIELQSVESAEFGARLTYIPADKVRKLNLRHEPSVVFGWRRRLRRLLGFS